MSADIRKAHKANDEAVMEAYGFNPEMEEYKIVAELFKLYKEKVDKIENSENSKTDQQESKAIKENKANSKKSNKAKTKVEVK